MCRGLRSSGPSACLFLGLAVLVSCVQAEDAPRGDVVLITIDTLRYDHVGVNSSASRARTPNIDALAVDGVRFTEAWSPISVTGPAFASLHSGKPVSGHGVLQNFFRGGQALGAEHTTLAEVLKSAGYRTGAFLSGFTLRRDVGLDQGFEAYEAPEEHQRRDGDKTVELAIDWFARSEEPAFLWYHSYDPHGPLKRWARPDVGDRRLERAATSRIAPYQRSGDIVDPEYYRRAYAAAVEFADAQVGRLLSHLRATGRYDGALIVLTADHGEGFDERDVWFEHGSLAYEEELHVPLVLKLPGAGAESGVHDAMVSLLDIAPTVTEVLRLPPLPGVDGRHLLTQSRSQIDGESSHCKPYDFLDCAPPGVAGKMMVSRTETATLLRRSTAREGAVYELYDRRRDALELSPLRTESHPPAAPVPRLGPLNLVTPLQLLVDQRSRPELDGEARPPAEIDADALETLRALGYLQ